MSLLGLLGRGFAPSSGLPTTPWGGITLTAVDNGDDSGATVTLADSDGAATNRIFAAPWSGGMQPGTFTEEASRLGNGSVVVDLDAGYWWLYAASEVDGVAVGASEVVGVRVTTGVDPLHWQCLAAVKAFIQALSLPGLVGTNVKIRKLPWRNLESVCPGILVTPLTEQRTPVDNHRDTLIWGVQVTTIFAKSNQGNLTDDDPVANNLRAAMVWRETICNAFSEKALAGVDEAFSVHVQPGPILLPSSFAENYDLGAFLLRCETQVYRGL